MTKDIKRFYKFFDLDYDATIDDVRIREKSMIKVARAKAIKSGKSNKRKINEIVLISEQLVDFIESNGVQPKENVLFDIKLGDIITQLSLAFIAFVVCAISFIALL